MPQIFYKSIFLVFIFSLYSNIYSMEQSFPDFASNITPPSDINFGELVFNPDNAPSYNEPFIENCVVTIPDMNDYDIHVADQSHASETSYAEQPTTNHNDSSFDNSMHTNQQETWESQSASLHGLSNDTFADSMRDTVLDMARVDREMEQTSHNYEAKSSHNFQKKIDPASSEPQIRLDGTISAVERKTESMQGNRALMQRLHQIHYERSGFHVFSNSALDKEFAFINMTLNGTTAQLLHDIQHGDLKTADHAFGVLHQAWPYKHAAGYIAPREISGAENRLMGLHGGDIMKQAELCLVSRPDYLQAHGDHIYREVIGYQKQYKDFESKGNLESLKSAEHELSKKLETKDGRLDLSVKARYVMVRKILSTPSMKSYAVIAFGPLQQAKQEVRYIEQQVFNHFARQGITDPVEINAMVYGSPYHETLIAAHRIFEARPDIQEALQIGEVKHLYHTADLSQAISEYTDQLELYKAYDFGDTARLESRIEKLNQVFEGNTVLSHETYTLSDNASGLLTKEGLDPQLYLECAGNQLQQHIHQECIGIVEELALPNHDVIAQAYSRSMLQFVDVAREYNQANSPIEAIKFADVCWSILDCCKAAGEGVINGAIGSVINHPLETAILCVGGPQYLLAYHLGKIAYAYVDIKIASLMSEEAGGQKLAEYMQPLTDCIDAIHAGDITLRGSIKVAATVATSVILQGKVNSGLKEFYTTTKKQAINYLKKNPGATVAQYAVTPDGRLLRAAGGLGNQPTTNSGILNNIVKREQVLPQVKTYEQAKKLGLKIIGQVDQKTRTPMLGKKGVCLNKLTGNAWYGDKVTFRLDWDPIKGPHINVTDYRLGKGSAGVSVAIPFEGSEATVNTLLKHLNTEACLEAAKTIFEKTGNFKELEIILQVLRNKK